MNLEELEQKELKRKQVILGSLFVAALAFAALFAYWMGALKLGATKTVYVSYSFAGGIDRGSPIRLGGIKVGRVSDVSFEGTPAKILLEAQIDSKAFSQITNDSSFFINLAGLIGERYIEIVPGTGSAVQNGDKLVGIDPPRVDQLFSQGYGIFGDMRDFFKDNKEDIKGILESLNSLSSNLNTLVGNASPAQRKQFQTLIENFSKMSTDLRYTVSKMRSGIEHISKNGGSASWDHMASMLEKANKIERNDIRRLMLEDGVKVNFSTKRVVENKDDK